MKNKYLAFRISKQDAELCLSNLQIPIEDYPLSQDQTTCRVGFNGIDDLQNIKPLVLAAYKAISGLSPSNPVEENIVTQTTPLSAN